jgi:hypothetical protein
MYGRATFVENLILLPMIAYQFWNLVLCLVNPDLYDPAMIGHHVGACILPYICLHPFTQYYTLFFLGFIEITNIPLTFVDIFKYFPELKARHSLFNEICRYSFALSFVIVRLIATPIQAIDLYRNSFSLLLADESSPRQPHSRPVLAVAIAFATFLIVLQFYWGAKIFGFLFKSRKN